MSKKPKKDLYIKAAMTSRLEEEKLSQRSEEEMRNPKSSFYSFIFKKKSMNLWKLIVFLFVLGLIVHIISPYIDALVMEHGPSGYRPVEVPG